MRLEPPWRSPQRKSAHTKPSPSSLKGGRAAAFSLLLKKVPSRTPWSTERVRGQPGLYRETPSVSKNKKNRKKKEKEEFFLLCLSLPPPFPLPLTSSSSTTTSCSQEGRQNKFLTDTALSLESSGALNSDKQGLTIFRILTCCEFCFSPSGVQNPRPCAHCGNFNLSFQANFFCVLSP